MIDLVHSYISWRGHEDYKGESCGNGILPGKTIVPSQPFELRYASTWYRYYLKYGNYFYWWRKPSKTVNTYMTPLRLGNKFVSKTFYTKNIYYSIALLCIKNGVLRYFIQHKNVLKIFKDISCALFITLVSISNHKAKK